MIEDNLQILLLDLSMSVENIFLSYSLGKQILLFKFLLYVANFYRFFRYCIEKKIIILCKYVILLEFGKFSPKISLYIAYDVMYDTLEDVMSCFEYQ